MFSDDEIKEIPESHLMKPGDEIISIHEVCLGEKFDKKEFNVYNESFLPSSNRNDVVYFYNSPNDLSVPDTYENTSIIDLDVTRPLYRSDTFFNEGLESQARFAWTEQDGNIAALVSEPGFGTTGQTTFGKDLDAALKGEMKEPDTSASSSSSYKSNNDLSLIRKPWYIEPDDVSSTSMGPTVSETRPKNSQGACKVDKWDPRSRYHFVKYIKRHGRTIKLWECGICGREFQHQYTLMRHLPTHTDERNFHCDVCGKSFRQLSTLSQHRAIHSSARPYACEVCNKTFNRVSTLISHRKTHSENKPYKCHICPKGFHQKGNLRNHLFTHTNERPYRCNICYKGFNQQSNLVCHKNKAHPDDNRGSFGKATNTPRVSRSVTENKPEPNRPSVEYCEVSSSVGPYLPEMENPCTSSWNPKLDNSWERSSSNDFWSDATWIPISGNGVVVDAINTYHMGVALATKQTPFALLKPNDGAPVLVKVVDAKLPGGKQMLVPATAEDLRVGGKIVVNNESNSRMEDSAGQSSNGGGEVQIRVPVVATVVPKFRPGGRLHLSVEEPHNAYHTALSADVGEVKVEPCLLKQSPKPMCSNATATRPQQLRRLDAVTPHPCSSFEDQVLKPGDGISSTCSLPPPAPSPPLDLMASMDLFETMECIPMGPQITAVDNIGEPPCSDDSDIFIGEFEESIPLSDSD